MLSAGVGKQPLQQHRSERPVSLEHHAHVSAVDISALPPMASSVTVE